MSSVATLLLTVKKTSASEIVMLGAIEDDKEVSLLSLMGTSSIRVSKPNRLDLNKLTSEQCRKMFHFEEMILSICVLLEDTR